MNAIATEQPLDEVLERIVDGSRLRNGNGWISARSAVFSLAHCSVSVVVEPGTSGGSIIKYELDQGCENFAPFAEREILSMVRSSSTAKSWPAFAILGLVALLGAALLAR
jgi:hypothetical protein